MAKTNKRALAMMVAVIMILCLVPIVSMAATISDLKINYVDADDQYVVSGTITTSGADVTMMALRADEAFTSIPVFTDGTVPGSITEDNIMYIDQQKLETNETTFDWTFSLRDNGVSGNDLTVFFGGTGVDTVSYVAYDLPGDDLLAGPAVAFPETPYTVYVNDSIEIKFTDDSEWRAAITSITIGGTEVFSSSDTTKEGKIILPAQPVGTVGEVVITATGYNPVTVTGSASVELRPAGVVTLGDYSTLGCFVAGSTNNDAVVDLSDSVPEGWLTAVNISVVDIDGEGVVTEVGSVDKSTGLITITKTGGAPDTVTTYTLQFRAENYEDLDVDFDIVSKVGALIINLREAVTVDWAEKTGSDLTDEENYYITVPASDTDDLTGLSFVCKVYDGDQEVSYDSEAKAYKIARKPAGEGSKTAYVKAIIDGDTDNPITISTITVTEIGASGTISITEDDVTLTTGDAFGITGAKVVTIKLDSTKINATTHSIVIGDDSLYYSPERSTGGIAVFVGMLRTNNDTASVVAGAAQVVETPSVNLYYGKVSAPAQDLAIMPGDTSRALQMYKNTASFTDAQYLAADVIGNATILPGHVSRILASYKNGNKTNYEILK